MKNSIKLPEIGSFLYGLHLVQLVKQIVNKKTIACKNQTTKILH